MDPATELEEVIAAVRVAQRELDASSADLERILNERSNATDRLNRAGDNLESLKEKMFSLVVQKPWTDQGEVETTPEPVRVLPSYRDGSVRLEEGVDAAWSDKGPEA